jgi:hypothetical protein
MKQTDMKWFECTAEKVEMIYQLIEAENAQDAERQFLEMYSNVCNVRVKEWEWMSA